MKKEHQIEEILASFFYNGKIAKGGIPKVHSNELLGAGQSSLKETAM